jgi:fucose 4-O-acetylase-like acetyltransferase
MKVISIARNHQIDNLKGFAIIIVVLGHAIQASFANFDSNLVFNYIYSFHMPLFMFLSGYVLYGKDINLLKRIKTLVIPFVSWGVLQFFINLLYGRSEQFLPYVAKLIYIPDRGLWFLWALFLNTCYLKLILYFANHEVKYADLIVLMAGYLLLERIPTGAFGIGLVKWYFLFFSLGYLTPKYWTGVLKNPYFRWISVILFIILGYFWRRIGSPLGWDQLTVFLTTYHVASLIPHLMYIYTHGMPIVGIAASFGIIPDNIGNHLLRIINYLGRQSFEIYVVHQNLLFGLGESVMKVVFTVIKSITLSLLAAFALKRIKILDRLLYGGR